MAYLVGIAYYSNDCSGFTNAREFPSVFCETLEEANAAYSTLSAKDYRNHNECSEAYIVKADKSGFAMVKGCEEFADYYFGTRYLK